MDTFTQSDLDAATQAAYKEGYNAGWIDRATDQPSRLGWASQEIWQQFVDRSLICEACTHPTAFSDTYCGECGTKLER
jgi:hypothetical protein